MPWYQAGKENGFTYFLKYPTARDPSFEVTDEYLNALERAYHQGQFDVGISNVEDTSSIVFDFLATNGVTTTQQAYALGRQTVDQDPGGSIDPNYISGTANTPGVYPVTPPAQLPTQPGGVPMPGQQDAYGTVSTAGAEGSRVPPSPQYSGPPSGPGGTYAGDYGGYNPVMVPGFGSASFSLSSINPFYLAAGAALLWLVFRKKKGS